MTLHQFHHSGSILTITRCSSNDRIFKNLQLCYECEFAPITKTVMTREGTYDQAELMSHWSSNHAIYLFAIDAIPAGFCVVNHESMIDSGELNVHDIAEFYMAPLYRKKGYGTVFAKKIFEQHKGIWEVRQLSELEHTSRKFWLAVIKQLPIEQFEEMTHTLDWKGFVQRFSLK